MAPPTLAQRLRYGAEVMRRASGVLTARLQDSRTSTHEVRRPGPHNTMFSRRLLADLEPERRSLQTFDLYLFDIMNSERLRGEKVFEYGLLMRGILHWQGVRVLDVGTGRSTLPQWMAHGGANVTTFDLPDRAERRWGGFQERVNGIVARRDSPIRGVAGSMRQLPFATGSFDLVTSLSVVEHLDTDLPDRTYVPYDEQCRRLGELMDEMIRVTRPGGHMYLTSECCDFDRATTDAWRSSYYYVDGPPLSGAWPVRDVQKLFYEYVSARGCALVGGNQFDVADIENEDHWSFRGPFFSGFSMLAQKRQ